MKLNLDFNKNTKLNDWWKIVKSAFEALQSNFNSEESNRKSAVSMLENKLTAEKNSREQKDTELQNSLNSEKNLRKADYNELKESINSEKELREAADTIFQNNLDKEITQRKQNEQGLQNNINVMFSSCMSSSRNMVNNEKSERENACNELQSSIEELRQELDGIFRIKFIFTGDLPVLSLTNTKSDNATADIDLTGMFTVNGTKCGTMQSTAVHIVPSGRNYITVSFNINTHEISLSVSTAKMDGYNIENNILTFTLAYYECEVYLNDEIDSPDYGEFYISSQDSCLETRELKCV